MLRLLKYQNKTIYLDLDHFKVVLGFLCLQMFYQLSH
ncbi:unnamed protein product, partial [Brassica oleracea]